MALCNACSTAPGSHGRNRLGHRFAHLGQAAASSTLTAMSNRLQAVLLLVPPCSSGLQWLIVSCRASSAHVVCVSFHVCVLGEGWAPPSWQENELLLLEGGGTGGPVLEDLLTNIKAWLT
jgi:hypothetical protein